MRRTEKVSSTLTWAIAFALAVTAPWLGWSAFDAKRNNSGGLDMDQFIFVSAASLLVTVSAFLGGIAAFVARSKWGFVAVLLLSVLTVLAYLIGGAAGERAWRQEFDENRRTADGVVEALRQHKQEHGDYPERLKDLSTPLTTFLRRGRHTHPFGYQRTSNGFVLRYSYGWGEYVYDSAAGHWDARD